MECSAPTDTFITQLLYIGLRDIMEEKAEIFYEPEDQEVCRESVFFKMTRKLHL